MRMGIVGGTGKEGRGLAVRLARAGHEVAIGSRDPERAKAVASDICASGPACDWGTNEDVCRRSELVILCVPYSAHASTLQGLKDNLAGKILVDITVPLKPPHVRRVHLPPGRAAAIEAQAIVGSLTRVVATLHHVSAAHLAASERTIPSDVLVCSDDDEARRLVIDLMNDIGGRGLDAGPLENAVALEALTPVLLHLNKTYAHPGAGVRFLGLQ